MAKKAKVYRSDEKSRFLFPLTLPIGRSELNPVISRLARSLAATVPLPVSAHDTVLGHFGGQAPHSGLSPFDDFKANVPHLRVSFVLHQMEHEVVSGNGVNTAPKSQFGLGVWVVWETHGSAATEERIDGEVGLPVPGPGETWSVPHANLIYDALVQDGCGNTPIFPVTFHSSVKDLDGNPPIVLGEFSAVDNTTLQPPGFWTFFYVIRATAEDGGVSDFKFNGTVAVSCTNLASFS